MKFEIQSGKKYDVLAVLFCKEHLNDVVKEFDFLKNNSKNRRFMKNDVETFHENKTYFFVNLGKEKDLNDEVIREKMSSLVGVLKKHEIDKIWVYAPLIKKIGKDEFFRSVIEGMMLSDYSFDKFKKKKDKHVKNVILITKDDISKLVKETQIICSNVLLARDIINGRSDRMTIDNIVKIAKSIKNVKVNVLDYSQLKKNNLNLIIAVGKGAKSKPKLVTIEYGSGKKPIALVGKGVIFDSGGMDLKPWPYMKNMFSDKGGAVTAMIIVKTLSELNIKKHVVAVLPLCENMISNEAFRTGDIVKSYSGKTVEVINTDAEGRLILADGLAYADKKYKPSLTIDMATLTGTALVIFGEYVAPIMGTDSKSMRRLFKSGIKTHERVWKLPLYKEFVDEMKGEVSDVKNLGYNDGRYAGTLTAGGFLSNFVKSPWIHIDIAGTAWYEKPRKYMSQGATGFGVRLLVDFLRSLK